MNYWKVILATMVIFGTGVITGALLERQAARTRLLNVPPPALARPLPNPAGNRLEFLRRMEVELKLSPDQRQRLDVLIAESQERTKAIMEPVSPRIREEVQRTKEEFRAMLNPRQRRIYDELTQKRPPANVRDRRESGRDPREPRVSRPPVDPTRPLDPAN